MAAIPDTIDEETLNSGAEGWAILNDKSKWRENNFGNCMEVTNVFARKGFIR